MSAGRDWLIHPVVLLANIERPVVNVVSSTKCSVMDRFGIDDIAVFDVPVKINTESATRQQLLKDFDSYIRRSDGCSGAINGESTSTRSQGCCLLTVGCVYSEPPFTMRCPTTLISDLSARTRALPDVRASSKCAVASERANGHFVLVSYSRGIPNFENGPVTLPFQFCFP